MSSEVVLHIEYDVNSFFYSIYLAIHENSPELNRDNISKAFTSYLFHTTDEYANSPKKEKQKMDEDIRGLYVSTSKYRSYAFKPINDFLSKITKKQKSEEEKKTLFDEYNKLVNPYLTELAETPNEVNNEIIRSLTYNKFDDLKNAITTVKDDVFGDRMWPTDNDVCEFEKNYNKDNPTKQIKILKQNQTGDKLELFKNQDGETNLQINEHGLTFVVLRSYGNGNYKLVVTLNGEDICKKYKLSGGRGLCILPENYKAMLLKELNKLKTSKPDQTAIISNFISYIEGKPLSKPGAASKEELHELLGSETATNSDIASASNYSDSSEHQKEVFFKNLIGMVSFDDSLKDSSVKINGTICDDPGLKKALDDKTPNKNGLLGGTKHRSSKKNRFAKINKQTKKRKRT